MEKKVEKFVLPGDMDTWCILAKLCMLFEEIRDWDVRCNYENNTIIITVKEK